MKNTWESTNKHLRSYANANMMVIVVDCIGLQFFFPPFIPVLSCPLTGARVHFPTSRLWPCDMLWTIGCQKIWHKRCLGSTCVTGFVPLLFCRTCEKNMAKKNCSSRAWLRSADPQPTWRLVWQEITLYAPEILWWYITIALTNWYTHDFPGKV